MKKIAIVFLVLAMLVCFAGCGSEKPDSSSSEPVSSESTTEESQSTTSTEEDSTSSQPSVPDSSSDVSSATTEPSKPQETSKPAEKPTNPPAESKPAETSKPTGERLPEREYFGVESLGADGTGFFGRAGEDYGFYPLEGCEKYIKKINRITCVIDGVEFKVYQALSREQVKKVVNKDDNAAEFYEGVYSKFIAVIGIEYPPNVVEKLKKRLEEMQNENCPCNGKVTLSYTLTDGTERTQTWDYMNLFAAYFGTILSPEAFK